MTKHTLPPLVSGFKNGNVTWQRIEDVDYDTLGYLLSCHLIIEHYLDHFLSSYAIVPFGWKEAKLTFGQKIALVSKRHFSEPYDLVPAIKHLNSLRNKFSHNISTTLSEADLLPFSQLLEKCSGGKAELPTNPKDILNNFTTMVCAYFAGYIVHRAGLKK